MKRFAWFGIWLSAITAGFGQDVMARYDWEQVAANGAVAGGKPSTVDGRSVLEVRNTNNTALQVALLKIQRPAISNTLYAVVGEVKYEKVQGNGYLEMWNFFPPLKPGLPEGQFFSRTLGDSGPMGRLTGTSGWRAFQLPFDRTGASGPPTRLELNLFLPGSGTVYLSSLQLVQYAPGSRLSGGIQGVPWWSDRTAGVAGGAAGALIGCLAALLNSLAARGRARPFVVATLVTLIALGASLAFLGLAGLSLHQPYTVWFPLLLLATLLLVILPTRLRHYRRHYETIELRRMNSMDTVNS